VGLLEVSGRVKNLILKRVRQPCNDERYEQRKRNRQNQNKIYREAIATAGPSQGVIG